MITPQELLDQPITKIVTVTTKVGKLANMPLAKIVKTEDLMTGTIEYRIVTRQGILDYYMSNTLVAAYEGTPGVHVNKFTSPENAAIWLNENVYKLV